MTGKTNKDSKVILNCLNSEIDLFVDDTDRVWNNNHEYIANCIRTEPGNGIGC
jgi:hypothetical protein